MLIGPRIPVSRIPGWRSPRREQFIWGPREKPFPGPNNGQFPVGPNIMATRGVSMPNLEITWTKVDEAPALATYSLLPIVEAFVGAAGVS